MHVYKKKIKIILFQQLVQIMMTSMDAKISQETLKVIR